MSKSISKSVWLLLISSVVAFGQLNRGSLTGTVTGASGAVIPGIGVTIKNTGTNAIYPTKTNAAGQYTMPNLPVGSYELTFEATGFKKLVRSGIMLGVTEVARVDALLEVGSVTESVQITAEAPRLQSDTPMVGTSLTNRELSELPVSWGIEGRVAEFFVYKIMPGTSGDPWTSHINGSTAFSKEALLDGVTVTTYNAGHFEEGSISVEAMQEFKVQTGAGREYYVDCAGGSDAASGDSPQAAWKSVARVSENTFSPGDAILLRRGTRCSGMLAPKGSGEEGRPLRIGAYGNGPLPVIDGGLAEAALKLFNQHHWEIENLETVGGTPFGVLVSGRAGILRHFRLRNLVVHDVGGEVKTKSSGLVAVLGQAEAQIEDVEIDGVVGYSTTQWAGIIVSGASPSNRIRSATVRNSIVHDVFGDGIVLFQVEKGLIEKSAAWLTGLQPVQTIGTPNAIWTWRCRKCTVQLTEGFWIDSPGVDGGVYDIDWGNEENIVQYNYGHDAQGYCAAIFGSKGVTTASVIRYNVCVNNGRSPKLARRQGDLYISTWSGGTLDGMLIHNNTFVWNPPIDAPAVQMDHAEFSGSRPNLVANNVIWSAVPSMIHSSGRLEFKRNLFWYEGTQAPKWGYGGVEYTGFARYSAVAADLFGPPRLDALLKPASGSVLIDAALALPEMGQRDAFGAPVPQGTGYDIGAIESSGEAETLAAAPPVWAPRRTGTWQLFLLNSAEARSQLVFVQTALAQYGDGRLEAAIGFEKPAANIAYDWNLGAVRAIGGAPRGPGLLLISPEGRLVREWRRFVTAAELGLTLKRHLGAPAGSPEFR